jgi:hypothetical protein
MTSMDLAIVFGPLFALSFVMIILFGFHHFINREG